MRKLCSKCGATDVVSPCHRCRKLAQQARDRQRDPIRRMQRDGHARTTLARQTKERDGHACRRCGITGPPRNPKGPTLYANHIIPLEYGGPNVLANMVTYCPSCHEAYHRALNAAIAAAHKRGESYTITSPGGLVVIPPPTGRWRPVDAEEAERLKY